MPHTHYDRLHDELRTLLSTIHGHPGAKPGFENAARAVVERELTALGVHTGPLPPRPGPIAAILQEDQQLAVARWICGSEPQTIAGFLSLLHTTADRAARAVRAAACPEGDADCLTCQGDVLDLVDWTLLSCGCPVGLPEVHQVGCEVVDTSVRAS